MPKINEILIIDIDFSENGDTGVITVGRQTNGKVDIINVFRGKDAEELYSKLEGRKTHNIKEESSISSWAEKEVEIACKHERDNTPDGEWDYGCACYESALKAYKSLMEDGHSGFSIGLTKQILNRLIDGKPLTPIEDTEDVWNDIIDRNDEEGYICFQCRRMSSLFKYVYADGTVKYKDVDRYYCVDINNTEVTYHSGLVQRIIDEIFPINMPYFSEKPIKVYSEDFLTDRKNGDFDTVGIFYAIKPDGEKVEINRFFKESEDDWKEIDEAEYIKRKAIKL